MATSDRDALLLQTSMEVRGLQKSLDRMNKANDAAFDRMQKRALDGLTAIEKRFETFKPALHVEQAGARMADGLKAAAGSIAAAFGVRELAVIADTYTRITNSLKVAGLEGERLAQVQAALYASAQKNGVELESLATLYGRAAQAAGSLGASQADLLKFTNTVTNALRVQGGDPAAASGALMQLSQALQAGTVRAEEFNSVNEGALPILQAAAAGSERWAGSVAKLRADVLAGKVSSSDFFRAILAGSDMLETKAAGAALTTAQAMTQLRNSIVEYVGSADQGLGISQAVAGAIKALADNLTILVPSVAALSTALGVGFVTNALRATIVARGLGVALLGAFGGPVGIAITAVTLGIAGLVVAQQSASSATQQLAGASNQTTLAIKSLNAILNQDPSQGVAKNARELAAARIAQAKATYTAAKAEIALRQSQGQARLKDLEDGSVMERGPRGIMRERRISDVSGRAGSDLARERGQAAKAIADAARDAAALDAAFKSTLSGIGKASTQPFSRPAGTGPTATKVRTPKADKSESYEELYARIAGDSYKVFIERFRAQVIAAGSGNADGQSQFADQPSDFKSVQDLIDPARTALARLEDETYDRTYYGIRDGLEAGMREGIPGVVDYLGDAIKSRLLDSLADILTGAITKPGGGKSLLAAGASIGKLFGFASGGNPPVGQPYVVGENGPEIRVDRSPSTILPNSFLKAMEAGTPSRAPPISVSHFHLDMNGAVTTQELLGQVNTLVARGGVQSAQVARTLARGDLVRRTRNAIP